MRHETGIFIISAQFCTSWIYPTYPTISNILSAFNPIFKTKYSKIWPKMAKNKEIT